MKKSELRSGMIVQQRNNHFAMVLLKSERGDILSDAGEFHDRESIANQTWCDLDSYDEKLTYVHPVIPDGDIVRVYGTSKAEGNMRHARFSLVGRELLWEESQGRYDWNQDPNVEGSEAFYKACQEQDEKERGENLNAEELLPNEGMSTYLEQRRNKRLNLGCE